MDLFAPTTEAITDALGGENGVFEHFRAAAASASPEEPRWAGLAAPARAQLASRARSQVHALAATFARARELLAALPAARHSDAAFAEAAAAARSELLRLRALADALPPPPGAPSSAPPQPVPPSPPLRPSPDQVPPPLAAATLALEAYRESLLRALEFLEAAAVGQAALPPRDIAGALDGVLEAALRGEEGLNAASACLARAEKRARVEAAPLEAQLAAARAEAAARAASLCSRSQELEAALSSARCALRGLREGAAQPVELGALLEMGARLAGAGGGGGPTSAQLAGSLCVRLRQQLAGRLVHVHDATFAAPGLPPLPLAELQAAAAAAAAAGAGGEGTKEGASTDLQREDTVMEPPVVATTSAPLQAVPAPAPLPPIMSLITALTPQARAALLALLPPGWRPGQPLPPHLPDLRTLLARVGGGD